MQINRDGVELIKLFEGYRENAYKCSAGTWTIGYGSTKLEFGEPVQEGDIIDRSRAETLLVAYIRTTVEPDMTTLLGSTALTPDQQSAFGSFVYNFGLQKCLGYNLPKYIAAGEDWEKIGRKWLEYVYSDGEKEEGLHRRRLAELMLFYDFPNWKAALSSYWGDEEKLFFIPMKEKESAPVKEAPPASIPDRGPTEPRERIVIKDIEEVKQPEIKPVTIPDPPTKPPKMNMSAIPYGNVDTNADPKDALKSKRIWGLFIMIASRISFPFVGSITALNTVTQDPVLFDAAAGGLAMGAIWLIDAGGQYLHKWGKDSATTLIK